MAKGLGDCYVVAARLITSAEFLTDPTARLVHGTVERRSDGLRHSHAWIETSQTFENDAWPHPITMITCIDRSNGLDMALPGELFYKVGRVSDVTRYTPVEAMKEMLRTGQYGPWDTCVS